MVGGVPLEEKLRGQPERAKVTSFGILFIIIDYCTTRLGEPNKPCQQMQSLIYWLSGVNAKGSSKVAE